MTLQQNSVESLRARIRHLEADFEFWRGRTVETGDLKQHQSQVQRITDVLTGTLEESLGETPVFGNNPVPANLSLGALPEFRRDIGTIHLLWEFFRDKLAQRDVASFENHLGCADDLAWACYKPCLAAAVAANNLSADAVKEPPLVFYSTYRTPFAQARTKMFHPQGLDSKDVAAFAEVLTSLPVPVIGLPWSVANRLPELVLVGHEAGHVVAEDLGMADEAAEALEAVVLPNDPGSRRLEVWGAWCDEVFADLFGVLSTGRSFVSALGAELAADVQETHSRRIDEQRPGSYPTPTLRMAMCEKALERLGVPPPDAWTVAYAGLSGDSSAYADDIAPVVEALLFRSWDALGQKRLPEVLPWGLDQENQADQVSQNSLQQHHVAVPFDVRVWVAAAMRAALEDAATYANLKLDQALAGSIVHRRADTVRFAHVRSIRAGLAQPRPGVPGLARGLQAADETRSEIEQSQRDLKAGRKLYGLLKSMR